MTQKKPRRTAQRILEVTLELFNRFGEPNVSTTAISAELDISPGNLYYHYPAKDALVNALFDRFEAALGELLDTAAQVRSVDDAWRFFHAELGLIWSHRFLYRDLNDLLSRNRRLETHFPRVLQRKTRAAQTVIESLAHHAGLRLPSDGAADLATALVLGLSYWLSHEYVRDPRHALEPANAPLALQRGTAHVAGLLLPHLEAPQRQRLQALSARAALPHEDTKEDAWSPTGLRSRPHTDTTATARGS
ncbi:TetR/AcrR family transcriptional regulator [Caldimonas tepidiphila]|uniref:TetR/AcrR family transcriptional regulator n=1 Tax=Caldimonas tepidiphila TaxID=2315841 RepID=UPI000E5C165C|nr:TetR/AcrR family transcriptional regulator [Caldimonas tepidiphila]